jgi:hypothetical protein
MRGLPAFLLVLFVLLPRPAHAAAGVAVVELYTSEGCSSCPPAERILSDLAAEARTSHKPIYALELHVDYWNSLGWRDPFSAATYSERQRAYGEALGEEQVYTPQMIVNGTNAFVGSNRTRADAAIVAGLAKDSRVAIEVASRRHGDTLWIDYRTSSAPTGAVLVVAWVALREVVRVPRGENAGRTLVHANVVRGLRVEPLDPSGRGVLELRRPSSEPGEVIAFVQDPHSLEILGAASVADPTATAHQGGLR